MKRELIRALGGTTKGDLELQLMKQTNDAYHKGLDEMFQMIRDAAKTGEVFFYEAENGTEVYRITEVK